MSLPDDGDRRDRGVVQHPPPWLPPRPGRPLPRGPGRPPPAAAPARRPAATVHEAFHASPASSAAPGPSPDRSRCWAATSSAVALTGSTASRRQRTMRTWSAWTPGPLGLHDVHQALHQAARAGPRGWLPRTRSPLSGWPSQTRDCVCGVGRVTISSRRSRSSSVGAELSCIQPPDRHRLSKRHELQRLAGCGVERVQPSA